MKNKKLLQAISVLIGMGIILFFSNYISELGRNNINKSEEQRVLFDLEGISDYLGMSEEEVKNIIMIEEIMLNTSGSYTGMMFPYFKVDDKYYFYKKTVDQWLEEVSISKKQYDSKNKYAF